MRRRQVGEIRNSRREKLSPLGFLYKLFTKKNNNNKQQQQPPVSEHAVPSSVIFQLCSVSGHSPPPLPASPHLHCCLTSRGSHHLPSQRPVKNWECKGAVGLACRPLISYESSGNFLVWQLHLIYFNIGFERRERRTSISLQLPVILTCSLLMYEVELGGKVRGRWISSFTAWERLIKCAIILMLRFHGAESMFYIHRWHSLKMMRGTGLFFSFEFFYIPTCLKFPREL